MHPLRRPSRIGEREGIRDDKRPPIAVAALSTDGNSIVPAAERTDGASATIARVGDSQTENQNALTNLPIDLQMYTHDQAINYIRIYYFF
jgi:hypothetical protein